MNRRGVCYDVGRVMWGQDWRPQFSPEEAHRELQIIRDDLHCNAVRICGRDLGRLMAAGRHALDCGLQVWLSPELWDHCPSETLGYVAKAAEAAQDLHQHRPGQVVFSVGSEATLFMAGIVDGGSVFERLEHPDFWRRVRAGEHNGPLNVFLAEAAERVREVFHGPVTYASVPLEKVEWSRFDRVSVDLYRGAELKDRFADVLHRYFAFGRPVAITEFGCCTYRGAAPLNSTSDDPLYDLDMASYSLVKSFGGRVGPLGTAHPEAPWDRSRLGTTYPGMPWEPKESFGAVADFYAAHTAPAT